MAVLLLHGCNPDQADALLEQAGGRLRMALRLAGVASATPTDSGKLSDIPTTVPDKFREK